jgi:hypothetical protein
MERTALLRQEGSDIALQALYREGVVPLPIRFSSGTTPAPITRCATPPDLRRGVRCSWPEGAISRLSLRKAYGVAACGTAC